MPVVLRPNSAGDWLSGGMKQKTTVAHTQRPSSSHVCVMQPLVQQDFVKLILKKFRNGYRAQGFGISMDIFFFKWHTQACTFLYKAGFLPPGASVLHYKYPLHINTLLPHSTCDQCDRFSHQKHQDSCIWIHLPTPRALKRLRLGHQNLPQGVSGFTEPFSIAFDSFVAEPEVRRIIKVSVHMFRRML